MKLLKVTDLHVSYGAITAVKGVSFHVNEGEIVTLIGANGAGKTTVMHAISGLLKPASGTIEFLKKNISTTAPHKIIAQGLVQVPEGRRIFAKMTVKENLSMGAYLKKAKANDYQEIYSLFPRLHERRRQLAGTLSGGEQQMLAIGRALMSKPKMLLLDEPSMGLAPILVKEIFRIIKECNNAGVTILLVEQNANMALSIADRAYVLETGLVALEGSAEDLIANDDVKKAYLGA
ncbi:MAG: ABC transporter ATP-binding protein [Clostridiales bacterium]|jgi:branched-chain amino acid transport system ATP-binding protein|nr:ABC transporter ATP-binding protein [Clostridiales bacterium]